MKIEIVGGNPIKGRWGEWYRHDHVKVDGRLLDGYIQVRRRYYGKRIGHRIESHTGIGGACVLGSDIQWLIRNQPQTTGVS